MRKFDCKAALDEAVAALLKYHFEEEFPLPHAVMLSGGNTPLEAYRRVAGEDCIASSSLHLLFSDERMVPDASPKSNYCNTRVLLDALNLNANRVLRVDPSLAHEKAAEQYDRALRKFVNGGGIISLGLLGLGSDGHTASLFSAHAIDRGHGRYAIAVEGPDGMKRVSVTPALLAKIRQIIFVVSGKEKADIVRRLTQAPSSVTAGLAVAENKLKQVWFAE